MQNIDILVKNTYLLKAHFPLPQHKSLMELSYRKKAYSVQNIKNILSFITFACTVHIHIESIDVYRMSKKRICQQII